MKTYNDYFLEARAKNAEWLSSQREKWWKKGDNSRCLCLKGDYLETVRMMDEDDKNDVSIFHNHTNICNSEWTSLFSALGQVLIDWCIENGKTDIWSYTIEIGRTVEGTDDIYDLSYTLKTINGSGIHPVADDLFDDCSDVICDILDRFIMSHRKDIPNDWNRFTFSLDSLSDSFRMKRWTFASDGYMSLGNMTDDGYDMFMECM